MMKSYSRKMLSIVCSQSRERVALWKAVCLAFLIATASTSPAETFKTLVNFDGTNGSTPLRSLIQGTDGNLYGTTQGGGKNGMGTVFEITPEGKLTTIYNFCTKTNCTDGKYPQSSLLLSTDGNFYGTTYQGGANCIANGGCGTVFQITPAGKLTTIYSFCAKTNCADGQGPRWGLIEGTDGSLYGTTFYGGNANNAGTLFTVTQEGTLTTLHSFCSKGGANCTDGEYPNGLAQGKDGYLYWTTSGGGETAASIQKSNPCDGVADHFDEFSPEIGLAALFYFCVAIEGGGPEGALSEYTSGGTTPGVPRELFYGMTNGGGANLAGVVFSLTSAKKYTRIYSFCEKTNCADGAYPGSSLVLATDGNFYGTTAGGNGNSKCPSLKGCGTIFSITPAGALMTLHSFAYTDGGYPSAGLFQATNGIFYGATPDFGGHGDGTLFSLDVGLGPFVQTVPTSGKIGSSVMILGTDLSAANSVTFNGKSAKFEIVSATEITATVPSGATTGTVEVKTSTGTLKSNVGFGILPQVKSFSPGSGPVGTKVTINGVSLTPTNQVAFGGVAAASVTATSSTQITATVPTGAKTGKITVTSPGGTGASSAAFTVTP